MFDIVISSYLEAELVERIRSARDDIRVHYDPDLIPKPRYVGDHDGVPLTRSVNASSAWQRLLARAEVSFDFDHVRPRNFLEHAPMLRWVQASSAGIDSFVRSNGLDRSPIAFTTAAGIHGQPLAEFVMWAMLSAAKNYPIAREQQRANLWRRFHSNEVQGSSMLLVGVGGVGRNVAKLARAMGVRVVGIKRQLAGVSASDLNLDALVPLSEIDAVLPDANHVVLACPLTPATEGLLNRERFDRFSPQTTLINIGRGRLVDTNALLSALDDGRVGTAVLDVTDPEPLPADHPLWTHERVIIFPHSASTSVKENERLVTLFLDNLDRFIRGQPLRNLYRRELHY
jgi:phosphoglycerate dehydrogenase-like enzyme